MTDAIAAIRHLGKCLREDGRPFMGVPAENVCIAAAAEIERLRAGHQDIIRKYEKIMGEPPDWTSFNENDERLKFAREAWFGAAQISRTALSQ